MSGEHILIIEDDEDIQELVRYNLAREGYEVSQAMTGEKGVALAMTGEANLVLLDLMLPGIDGLEVCRHIKGNPETHGIPVVMLTAKGEESDIVVGLEMGADDYITKPFSPRVLLARLRAVLRRSAQPRDASADEIIMIEDLSIDPGRHVVRLSGDPLELTATEFRILHFLAQRRGWVFTRDQIVKAVHGEGYPVTDRSVDVQIVGLRKKLGRAGQRIQTVRGVGYRFEE